MKLTADIILKRASITLQDDGNVRWPLPELLLYLNDAVAELAIHKPNAITQTIELALAEGTVQTLDDTHVSLVRAVRNLATLAASPSGRTGGRAITVTRRSTLDSVMPSWQDPAVLPYAATVDHVVQDMADPRTFYVVPGNDGTGVMEAVVAVLPADIAEPLNPLQIDSYTALELTGVPNVFRNALTDYVLFRAYSKDSADQSAASRASAHYNMFANAIGLKTKNDATANLKTTAATS